MKAYPRPLFRVQRRPRLHWIYDFSISGLSQALKSHLILTYSAQAFNDDLAFTGSMTSPSVESPSLTLRQPEVKAYPCLFCRGSDDDRDALPRQVLKREDNVSNLEQERGKLMP